MSKMDDLRAMREARYQQAADRASRATKTPLRREAQAQPAKATADEVAPPEAAPPTEALCGHRNMSGRTCTREQGHVAKSHRYS